MLHQIIQDHQFSSVPVVLSTQTDVPETSPLCAGYSNPHFPSPFPSAGHDYRQQATVPLDSETHGIEDVAIFAKGPMSHLFHGVQEQSYIAHVMAYAACLEPYENCKLPPPSHAGSIHPSLLLLLMGLLFTFLSLPSV